MQNRAITAGRGAVRDTTRNHGPAIWSPRTGIVVTVCAYQLGGAGATRRDIRDALGLHASRRYRAMLRRAVTTISRRLSLLP